MRTHTKATSRAFEWSNWRGETGMEDKNKREEKRGKNECWMNSKLAGRDHELTQFPAPKIWHQKLVKILRRNNEKQSDGCTVCSQKRKVLCELIKTFKNTLVGMRPLRDGLAWSSSSEGLLGLQRPKQTGLGPRVEAKRWVRRPLEFRLKKMLIAGIQIKTSVTSVARCILKIKLSSLFVTCVNGEWEWGIRSGNKAGQLRKMETSIDWKPLRLKVKWNSSVCEQRVSSLILGVLTRK